MIKFVKTFLFFSQLSQVEITRRESSIRVFLIIGKNFGDKTKC